MNESLNGKTILITDAARQICKIFALACARAGADVVIHQGHTDAEAEEVRNQIIGMGRHALVVKADSSDSSRAAGLIPLVNESSPLHALINSAAIFGSLGMESTSMEDWQKHLTINLTAPFLLSQAFAKQASEGTRIVNILDWRALQPGSDHFSYTIILADLPNIFHRRDHSSYLKILAIRKTKGFFDDGQSDHKRPVGARHHRNQ
jgi:NAD(P)-dependent dehydrogenase (short-subunit alcohol dehydrogenase family)